jgi:hypothetical protein
MSVTRDGQARFLLQASPKGANPAPRGEGDFGAISKVLDLPGHFGRRGCERKVGRSFRPNGGHSERKKTRSLWVSTWPCRRIKRGGAAPGEDSTATPLPTRTRPNRILIAKVGQFCVPTVNEMSDNETEPRLACVPAKARRCSAWTLTRPGRIGRIAANPQHRPSLRPRGQGSAARNRRGLLLLAAQDRGREAYRAAARQDKGGRKRQEP